MQYCDCGLLFSFLLPCPPLEGGEGGQVERRTRERGQARNTNEIKVRIKNTDPEICSQENVVLQLYAKTSASREKGRKEERKKGRKEERKEVVGNIGSSNALIVGC